MNRFRIRDPFPAEKSHSQRRAGASAAVLRGFALGAVMTFAVLALSACSDSTTSPQVPEHHVESLIAATVEVPMGAMWTQRFAIVSQMSHAMVIGSFSAEGGADNDIRCWIMTEDNFQQFLVSESFSAMYDSGVVVAADIATDIVTGDYRLVFDNFTIGNSSDRMVTADVNIEYDL